MLLSKAYSSMYGLVPPPYSRTFQHLAPFSWLISFYLSWNSLINIKKCYFSHHKKKKIIQHHVPDQLLRFCSFQQNQLKVLPIHTTSGSFPVFSEAQSSVDFLLLYNTKTPIIKVPYDLFIVKSNSQFPVLLLLGWLAMFSSWSLPPPYSLFSFQATALVFLLPHRLFLLSLPCRSLFC